MNRYVSQIDFNSNTIYVTRISMAAILALILTTFGMILGS